MSWRDIRTASAQVRRPAARRSDPLLREVAGAQACVPQAAVKRRPANGRRSTSSGELPRVVNEAEEALLARPRNLPARRPDGAAGAAANDPATNDDWTYAGHAAVADRDTDLRRAIPEIRRSRQRLCAGRRTGQGGRRLPVAQRQWKLPILAGIVNTPFLRPDGSLCETPGYDAASGMLFKPDGEIFPPIPQHPPGRTRSRPWRCSTADRRSRSSRAPTARWRSGRS